MKKIKLFSLTLIICLIMSFAAPAAFALEEPGIEAKAAVLVDLDSGRVLYSLNMDQQRSPASLTKIMTVLLALEAIEGGVCTMDTMITAQPDCRQGMDESSSTAGIQPGTELTMSELLYCAMIKSANEACNIIASYLGGSIEGFVNMMNKRAAELGCVNTNFVTTNGLSAEGHYSTAYDLYLITAEAIKHEEFLKMANTRSYLPSSPAVNAGETMFNSNALLHETPAYPGDYIYEYASGVKTGYTRAAGYCLISTAEKKGVNVLAVVMGCDGLLNAGIEEYKNFSSTITLYDWAFDNFSYQQVVSEADHIAKVDVAMAKDDVQAILRPNKDVKLLLPNDIKPESISTSVSVDQAKLTAPIDVGEVLGHAKIFVDGEYYGNIDLVNSVKIELSRSEFLKQKLAEVFDNGWIKALLIVIVIFGSIYLALVLRYRSLRKKHLREKMRRRMESERLYQEEDFYKTYDEANQFVSVDVSGEEDYSDFEDYDNY